MSAAQHTPTPWNVRKELSIDDSRGMFIASMAGSNQPANAAFIVRACNAHDALLQAAKTCLRAEKERRAKLKTGAPASTYTEARIAKIEAAIALTEPKFPEDDEDFDGDPDNDMNPDHRDREDDEQGFAL